MSFDKKARSSLSLKIILRLTFLMAVSYLLFFTISYFVLDDLLKSKDRVIAENRFNKVANLISSLKNEDAIDFLVRNTVENKFNDIFIRFTDINTKAVFLHFPSKFDGYDRKSIENQLLKQEKKIGFLNIDHSDYSDEKLIVYSDIVNNYVNLQVGIITYESGVFLTQFYSTLMFVAVIMILLATLFGYYFLKKTLLPIHNLITVIRSVHKGKDLPIHSSNFGLDEFDELKSVFDSMLLQTNKLLEALQNSVDSIAHDLRTPITHIVNRIQIAINSKDPNILKEALYNCLDELKDIINLLNTIMDISEAETKSLSLKKENFNLKQILDECVEIFEYAYENKVCEIELCSTTNVDIYFDRNRLKQIFINLFSNSIKYSNDNLKIIIRAEKLGTSTNIYFSDNGWGIPLEEQNRVWERLYRGDRSRTSRGMGLGLNLVKSIIELHSGTIKLNSELGKGTVFSLSLPNWD